jgi:hypothetical protein
MHEQAIEIRDQKADDQDNGADHEETDDNVFEVHSGLPRFVTL